jgi:hypothetical protein
VQNRNNFLKKPVAAPDSLKTENPPQMPHSSPMANEMVMLALASILKPHNGKKATLTRMRRRAMKLLKQAKGEGMLEELVRQVVLSTGIESFLPQRYEKYQPVVREGMVFMMSSMPLSRLAPKLLINCSSLKTRLLANVFLH